MSQEKLEDCSSVIVSLSEVLRDRHTDIQNDSVFLKVSYGILSTFEKCLSKMIDEICRHHILLLYMN